MSSDTNPPGPEAFTAAVARLKALKVSWLGKCFYHAFPYRRGVVFGNMRTVFGDRLTPDEYVKLAQAYYDHYASFLKEFLTMPWRSDAAKRDLVRVENVSSPIEAHKRGKGLILLTGHFGNWEVSTVAGIQKFPQYKGLFHFVRRPLKPKFFNDFVTRRFHKAGFGTIAKRGSLDQILDLLAGGAIVVYVFDQHAGRRDGIPVEFFSKPAGTFKSPALIALASGAPVVPARSWREADGTHVLRFEDPIEVAESDDGGEAIRRTTRRFNAALERMVLEHPEQWIWMHKRWKIAEKKKT